MYKEITALTLKDWINEPDVLLVDVRETYEFDQNHIDKALHIPLGILTVDQLPLNKMSKIVFQCRSGKRSLIACDQIIDDLEDGIELYSLEGGILAWIELGLPVIANNNR